MFELIYWCIAEIKKLKGLITSIFATLGQIQNTISGLSPSGSAGFLVGNGAPEGVVTGSPGFRYWDLDTDFQYTKVTGVNTNTGWFVH